jgi:hypothetical protein
MPTRKQRRRQQKLRRHDYEEVWVDEEGREIDVDPEALAPEPKRSTNGAARAAKTAKPKPRDAKGRPIREIQPPSWQRIFKRVAIFVPIMYLVISLTSKNLTVAGKLLNALVLALLLVPTMYVMDRVAYRTYLKRTGQAPQSAPRRKRD